MTLYFFGLLRNTLFRPHQLRAVVGDDQLFLQEVVSGIILSWTSTEFFRLQLFRLVAGDDQLLL